MPSVHGLHREFPPLVNDKYVYFREAAFMCPFKDLKTYSDPNGKM